MKYVEAVYKALKEILEKGNAYLVTQGGHNPYTYGGVLRRLWKEFGEKVIDYPVSEASMPDFCLGLSIIGKFPILFVTRMDFLSYGAGQLSTITRIEDMLGRRVKANMLVWLNLARGDQVDALHSGDFVSWYMHVPRVMVYSPIEPKDVYSAILNSYENGGVRFLYEDARVRSCEGEIERLTDEELMKARVYREGEDVTVVAYSAGVHVALKVAEKIKNVDLDVVGLPMLKPFDVKTVEKSYKKTGRLVFLGSSWRYCDVTAELCSSLFEEMYKVKRVNAPECGTPATEIPEKLWIEEVGEKGLVKALGKVM